MNTVGATAIVVGVGAAGIAAGAALSRNGWYDNGDNHRGVAQSKGRVTIPEGINVVAQTAVVAGIGALMGAAIAVPELRVIERQEKFLAMIGVDISKVSPAETRALQLAAIGAAGGAGIGGGWMGSGALSDAKNY